MKRKNPTKATEELYGEHILLERMLNTLEIAAHRAEMDPNTRPGFFIDTAEFIRGFADGCHHRKEENVLIKAMIETGIPSEGGPVEAMLRDHERGRALTRAMREEAEKWQAGDGTARQGVIDHAHAYITLLRNHMNKENKILFPMADYLFTEEVQARVADAFEQVEHEEAARGVHEKYLGLAERLEKEFAS